MSDLIQKAQKVKEASKKLMNLSESQKNLALSCISKKILDNMEYILVENKKDMENAQNKGIKGALLDRLKLTEDRIRQICKGIEDVIKLPDPVGEVISMWKRPNGLIIGQKECQLGQLV